VLAKIAPKSKRWTVAAPLPGGEVERLAGENGQDAFKRWLINLTQTYENYDPNLIKRLGHTLGTATEPLLAAGLGENLGGVFEAELQHFRDAEWASSADDVLWRRTKLGLHLDAAAKARVAAWFGEAAPADDGIEAPTHRFAVPGAD
jgi:glycerol-3-phosphate dehydrogenase